MQTQIMIAKELQYLKAEEAQCLLASGPAIIAPTEFTDLLWELRGASDCCRALSAEASADAELANEISAWRKNVEELEKLLPWVQGRLLVEKARLQALQAHVTAAECWAEASRGIL